MRRSPRNGRELAFNTASEQKVLKRFLEASGVKQPKVEVLVPKPVKPERRQRK